MSAQLSEAEVARRLPIWCALSDVFLDTELGEHHYQRIARTIRGSGFTTVEAEAIFRLEVAPAFAANLWSVAGEWAGWPEGFVRDRVLSEMNAPFETFLNRLTLGDLLKTEWTRIAAHLED